MSTSTKQATTARMIVGGTCALWWLAGGVLLADDRVEYARSVKPIFTARCYACHGALKQQNGLRLDTVEFIKKGGDTGPAIVPGRSAESRLVDHITGTGGARRMPPKSEGEGLDERQIAAIKLWIDQGAIGPADEKPEPDPRAHWAFKAPVRPVLPKVKDAAWAKNPIDAFLAAEHEKRGLVPQRLADKSVLLRRVYLDLIGLPPTRDELAAFLKDESPDTYEKVVDRLLASKQYGERWGRHWMDVWRYSDWWGLGAEVRNSQKHIWHWRDWIIESLNADKGYDQMLREMLAADELYPTDPDRLRATGFLARSYFIFNRNSWLEEVVEHTSKAFLGVTLNCARCHDHKYDPFAQQDYYRFRSFFEPYQVRTDMVAGETDFAKDGVPRVFDCNLDAPTYLFVRGDEKRPKKDRSLSPGVPEILSLGRLDIKPVALPPEAHSPGLRRFVLENHLKAADRQIAAARQALEQAKKTLAEIERKSKQTASNLPGESAKTIKPFLKDDFSKSRPDVWEMKAGRWAYQGGKLAQQQDGPTRGALRLKQSPPADFQARVKFTIRSGQMWKSVGVSFDVAGENEVLVYLSAVAGGSKLQITYKQGGTHVYPAEGMQTREVKVNEAQELTVRVRGQLVNVVVNGEHALAYRLPLSREAGNIELVTYDAKAEVTGFELAPLPAELVLAEPGRPPAKLFSVENARLAVVLAETALATAEAEPVSLRARAAADRARSQQPPSPEAKELARRAARAERQVAMAKAEEEVAKAELAVGMRETHAEKKLAPARDALAKARQALDSAGDAFAPLRGSLKTPESNLETDASRNKRHPTTSTGRRSALAKWMTDPRHPLTARVAVNHIWMRHFGKPLVPTVFDFGRKSTPPTHPELLDYLAVDLVKNGWSMKHLHRLIVTSRAYRLTSSSAGAAVSVKADPENRYYWRMNPVRMEAQVVRDSLLYLAGDLDLTPGGPAVPAGDETSRRRSLYFFHSHNEYNRFLSMFDDASVLECYRRAESIVPQQALALENSQLALASAEKIARRLTDRLGKATDAEFVRAAFEVVLGTRPTADEQAECARALTEWKVLAGGDKQPTAVLRARANLVHALLNHNDFVTIR
jgi:mono/diheme cytochrome c family protein